MIKDIKYISKRVIIGFLIAILLMLVKGNLIGNVYATNVDNDIVAYTDPRDPLNNCNNLWFSNMSPIDYNMCNNVATQYDYRPKLWADFQLRLLNSPNDIRYENSTEDYIANNPFSIMGTSDSFLNVACNSPDQCFSGIYRFDFINNEFTFPSSTRKGTNILIQKNNTYDFLIEIEKDSELTYYANSDTIQLTNDSFSLWVCYDDTCGNAFSNKIDIQKIEWIPPQDIVDGNPNQAYIKVRFNIKDTAEDKAYYVSRFAFDVGTIVGVNTHDATPFIFNTRADNFSYKINSMWFVKNGSISISSASNPVIGAIPGLDSTSREDILIKDSQRQCANTDIVCHLQNILDYLFDILVRIGNFFKNLIKAITDLFTSFFIPDTADIHIKMQHFFDLYNEQFGFIIYPFTLFSQIITRINTLFTTIVNGNANYVINIPRFVEPFTNTTLYNGGTLDLGYIFNYGALGNLYEIYYMFIRVYIILLFVNLCYDAFYSFVSGHGLSSSSNTTEDLKTFTYDEETGRVSSILRVRRNR